MARGIERPNHPRHEYVRAPAGRMAALTIRNLDESLKTSLRIQAARHGHSMEEEVRSILRQALTPPSPAAGLGSRLVSHFRDAAGELPLPERNVPRPPLDWDAPE